MLVVALSTAAAMGLAGFAGIKITPPSAIAPTLIMTLAIADSIHLLVTMLSEMQLPHIPSTDELRQRAQEMFANAPSLDEIAARAREIIFEAITAEMLPAPSGA